MRLLLVLAIVGLVYGQNPSVYAGDEPAKKERVKAPAFDADDAGKTVRWLAAEFEASRTKLKPRNDLSKKVADAQFQATLSTMTVKKVHWKFAVVSVGETTLELRPAEWGEPPPVQRALPHPHYFLGTVTLTHTGGAEWAKVLAGDVVILTGTVRAGRWDEQNGRRDKVNYHDVSIRLAFSDFTVKS